VARWPGRALIATADGFVCSSDDEETALSRFLAGNGELPSTVTAPGRLWSIVDLAPELRPRIQVPELVAACAQTLRQQPQNAVRALVEAGLGADRSIVALIATGLAASEVPDIAEPDLVRRMWSTLPAAAVLLAGGLLSDAECRLAAEAQCGGTLPDVLADGRDPTPGGRFGAEAERLAVMPPGQLAGVWAAADVVPRACWTRTPG